MLHIRLDEGSLEVTDITGEGEKCLDQGVFVFSTKSTLTPFSRPDAFVHMSWEGASLMAVLQRAALYYECASARMCLCAD